MTSETSETGKGPLTSFLIAAGKSQEDGSLESMIRTVERCGYEVMNVLHNSNRNKVFLVEEPESKEQKAVKCFYSAENFFKEKETQELLLSYGRHRNILLADRFIDEHLLMVSPHAARGNLYKLQMKDRLTLPQVEVVAVHVLDALQYLHAHNFVHRDVKLSNIVLDIGAFGLKTFQLIDFELARHLDSPLPKDETGMVIGTPHYVAPEVCLGNADQRSDLYAAGVTLYHCLAGLYPFDGFTAQEIIRDHLNKPVPDIRQYNPEINPAFTEVFERALAKSPARRYQSAVEFKREFLGAARKR